MIHARGLECLARRGDGWLTLFRVSKAKDWTIQWSTNVVSENPCHVLFDIFHCRNMLELALATAIHGEPRFRDAFWLQEAKRMEQPESHQATRGNEN